MCLHHPIRSIAFLAITLGVTVSSMVRADVPDAERAALIALYENTNGDSWYHNAHWNTDDPVCPGTGNPDDNWFGITCDGANEHVIGIDLSPTIFGNGLDGTLTPLDALTELEDFNVSNNFLYGEIPPLASLVQLKRFAANRNIELSGSLPDLSTLTHLQFFSIAWNSLTGTLPSLDGLDELEVFNVGMNGFTGDVPSIANHPHLQSFDVSSNALTGPLPLLQGLPELTQFFAFQNALTGDIPALDDVPNLTIFSVGSNQLSGTIPDLSHVPALTTLDVSFANLSGGFPDLSHVPALDSLFLSSDGLEGEIPDLSSTPGLSIILIDHNRFTGPLPELDRLPNLFEIDARSNALTGPIPDLDGLTHLTFFWLGDNRLTGTIPSLSDSLHLSDFEVEDNMLSGPLPDISNLEQFGVIDVSNNALTGPIPAAPPGLIAGASRLCPNQFDRSPGPNDAAWDIATGTTPWYALCSAPTSLDLDQVGLGGSWYDPDEAGQGLVMEVAPDFYGTGVGLLFGGWFTFDVTAAGGQRWYSIQGTVSASSPSATMPIYASEGGNFDAPPAVGVASVGQATLSFSDCDNGTLTYAFSDGSGRSGTIPLSRLGQNVACLPGGNSAPQGSYFLSGTWYEPATAGQGFVFDIDPEARALFAAWYTYAVDGEQIGGPASERWFTVQSSYVPGSGVVTNAPIYETTGGVFDQSTGVTTTPVGTANIVFQSCGNATLSYTFSAGANAGSSGSIALDRAVDVPVGCTL